MLLIISLFFNTPEIISFPITVNFCQSHKESFAPRAQSTGIHFKHMVTASMEDWRKSERFIKRMLRRIISHSLIAPFVRGQRIRQMLKAPPEVCIETTSRCNARCTMCPRENMRRPKAAMDIELFKKIVDQCVELKIKCIKLHNYGEPLLSPLIDRYISYIGEKSGGSIKILLVTNGILLDDRWANFLIDQGVYQVNISIDGATKETYEQIRKNCNFEQVVKNTYNMIQRKKERKTKLPKIIVEIIRMPENEHEIPSFVKTWEPLADEVVITQYTTRAGALKGIENGLTNDRVPCFRLWKQLVICSDGEAALCCADWDCEISLGNLNYQSLYEVWNATTINKIRNLHLQKTPDKIPICSRCNPEQWDSIPKWWFK
ncbi:Butyryl-CoA dehydrogenase (EC [Olavius algarvensis Delta 1 endosymbiont]|nr:Butyryl-CoA dehydrogenase (EC [Olavius algarvensis Delta 1 endosymbiont]